MFLGLFPILGALVALVPLPVLGGAGLALFGTVAASGIRTLSKVDFSGNANLVIVAFSLGMGIIPIAVPTFYDKFPEWFQVIFDSGITAAAITAVLLNIVFNIIGRKEEAEGPDLRRGSGPAAISEADEATARSEGRPRVDERWPGATLGPTRRVRRTGSTGIRGSRPDRSISPSCRALHGGRRPRALPHPTLLTTPRLPRQLSGLVDSKPGQRRRPTSHTDRKDQP